MAAGEFINNLKATEGEAAIKVPNSAATNNQLADANPNDASAVNDDDLSDEPIPFPFGAKVAHFPAFASRGPLFRIGFSSSAKTLPSEGFVPIKHQGSRKIEFCGHRLTMHDKGVWEAVIDMAKTTKQGIGGTHQFALAEIARCVGKVDDGGATMNWIFQRLTRLANGKLRIARNDGTFHIGSLIRSVAREKGNVSIRFDRELMLIAFGQELQFRSNAARRSLLGTSLAKWLHDFYSSHTSPIDFDLKYIRERCGYEGQPRHFPERLMAAMEDIKARAPEVIKDFKIDSHRKKSDFWMLSVVKGDERPSFDAPSDDSAARETTSSAPVAANYGKPRAPRARWAQY